MRHLLFVILLLSGLAAAQRVGEAAPDFNLHDSVGKPVTISDFVSQPLLINFWATWCSPCQEELPLFQQVAEQTPELQVLLINAGEGREQAARYLGANALRLRTAVNPTSAHPTNAEDTLSVARRYRVRGMPTTFFINTEGIIESIYVGEIPTTVLSERLEQIGVLWQP